MSREIPPRSEVERQLAVILRSGLFKRKSRLRELLEYLVVKALDDVPVNEKLIGEEVFKRTKLGDEDYIVRANANHLRSDLLRYYAIEAPDALVLIELPGGPGYRPVFSYNVRSEAQKEFRVGIYHLDQQSARDLGEALGHFERTLALAPEHGGAHAGRAEALCALAMYNPVAPPTEIISAAAEAAANAIRHAEGSWRSYVAQGIVSLCRRNLGAAREAFDEALRLSPVDTRDHIWYPIYLFTGGKLEEAVATTRSVANDKPDKPEALRLYGMYLYLNRQFKEAEEALSEMLRMDRNSWVGHLTIAFVFLATARPKEALAHLQKVERVLDAPEWPGLSAVCLGQLGNAETALLILEKLKAAQSYVQPLQFALAYMACDQHDNAITELEVACRECDPFMIWLQFLPVLDPLRKHVRFQKLLTQAKTVRIPLI
jgi:tetratricopeptide (TPR) repeat protein